MRAPARRLPADRAHAGRTSQSTVHPNSRASGGTAATPRSRPARKNSPSASRSASVASGAKTPKQTCRVGFAYIASSAVISSSVGSPAPAASRPSTKPRRNASRCRYGGPSGSPTWICASAIHFMVSLARGTRGLFRLPPQPTPRESLVSTSGRPEGPHHSPSAVPSLPAARPGRRVSRDHAPLATERVTGPWSRRRAATALATKANGRSGTRSSTSTSLRMSASVDGRALSAKRVLLSGGIVQPDGRRRVHAVPRRHRCPVR